MPFISWRRVVGPLMTSKGNPIVKVRVDPLSKATAAPIPLLYFMEQKACPVGVMASEWVAA